MPHITLAATDGSALPTNPGPAAWAYVIADDDFEPGQPVSGALGWSTNNVGELVAIREVLKATEGPIVIRADSQYAIAAAMGLHKVTKNTELIGEIRALVRSRNVAFEHVRAHQADGDRLNDVADRAANAAATAQGPLTPPAASSAAAKAERKAKPPRKKSEAAAAKKSTGLVLVTARFPSMCSQCGGRYDVGASIVKYPDGWGHEAC